MLTLNVPFLILSALALPVQQQHVAGTSAAPVPPTDSRRPTNSQLAAAEPDRGLHVAQAHATSGTVQPPLGQTGKSVWCTFHLLAVKLIMFVSWDCYFCSIANEECLFNPSYVPFFIVASERHKRQTSIAAAAASTHQPPVPTSDLYSAPQLQVPEDRRLARLESCGEERDPQSKSALWCVCIMSPGTRTCKSCHMWDMSVAASCMVNCAISLHSSMLPCLHVRMIVCDVCGWLKWWIVQ